MGRYQYHGANYVVVDELEKVMNSMKNIRIMCPNLKCRCILVVPGTAIGKRVKCSNCTTLFKVLALPSVPSFART